MGAALLPKNCPDSQPDPAPRALSVIDPGGQSRGNRRRPNLATTLQPLFASVVTRITPRSDSRCLELPTQKIQLRLAALRKDQCR